MQLNESYPHQREVEMKLRALNESWAVAWNAHGVGTVYLQYRQRFYPLGCLESVASLDLGVLGEAIALAKRHSEIGYDRLPAGSTERMEIVTPGYGQGMQAELEPPLWLQQLESPVQPRIPRHTVPLARLRVPTSALHQLLQLPADYHIKQVAMEEDVLCVYCLTPECVAMDTTPSNPTIHADYQVEERDGVSWRSLVSITVEPAAVQ